MKSAEHDLELTRRYLDGDATPEDGRTEKRMLPTPNEEDFLHYARIDASLAGWSMIRAPCSIMNRKEKAPKRLGDCRSDCPGLLLLAQILNQPWGDKKDRKLPVLEKLKTAGGQTRKKSPFQEIL